MNLEFGKLDPATYARRGKPGVTWRSRSTVLRIRAIAILLMIDCVAVFGGFTASALLRGLDFADRGWVVFASVLLPMYIAVAANMHAYAIENLQNPLRAVRQGVQALVLAISVLIIVVFYLKSIEILPRLTIAIGSVLSVALLASWRYAFLRRLKDYIGGNPFCAFLVIDGDQPIPEGEFSVIIPAENNFDPERDDPAMYDRFAQFLSEADRVVVACPAERRLAWAHALRGANIQSEILVPELIALRPLALGPDPRQPTIVVAQGPLSFTDRGVKRLFDLVVSITALILLAPLLLAVAIWVKLDSPGPVFFKQARIGRGNAQFKVYKFRSMRTDSCDADGSRLTTRDDDRVTRSGKFIRATSIDELPQLFNIVLGQMSLVGPRPHALAAKAADKLYWEVDSRYWHRHAAKPGLTGLAQVRGFRGNTFQESDLTSRLQADLEYLNTWSIFRDLKIIFLTIRVLFHRNAF